MKRLIILIPLLTLVYSSQGQPAPPPAEELNKLNFWVGRWNLTWEGGKGTNHIESKYDGRVIQENFEATEGRMKGFKGTSISTYNAGHKKWHQAWADSNGGYFNFVGDMEGDKRIFYTEEPRTFPNGKSFIFRMRFHNIEKDSFTWDWERSSDNGETWELSWRIKYERVE